MKYEAMAETRATCYPDGVASDFPIQTNHGPVFRWTKRGARRWVRTIGARPGLVVFRWSIFRTRSRRHDRFIDSGLEKP